MPRLATANEIASLFGGLRRNVWHRLERLRGQETRREAAGALRSYLMSEVVQARGGDDAGPIPPLALVQQLQVIDGQSHELVAKGQLVSGFGEHGKAVGADVSVNLGDLILPGFVTVEVKGSVKGTKTKYLLVALQRQGRYLRVGAERKEIVRPVALMFLEGLHAALEVKVQATIGVGIPSSVTEKLPEEVTLSLGAEASAGAGYTGEVLRLRDPSPGWHTSTFNPEIAKDFGQRLPDAKGTLKGTIARYLASNYTTKFAGLRKKIREEHNPSDILKKALEDAEKEDRTSRLAPEEIARRTKTLEDYRARLERAIAAEEKKAAKKLVGQWKKLCRLTLWGHSGHAGAKVEAKASIGGSIGASQSVDATQAVGPTRLGGSANVGKTAEVHAGAGAGAAVHGQIKHTAYRFQTFEPVAPPPLIATSQAIAMTQDTVITYRQATVSAEAWAKASAQIDLGAEAAVTLSPATGQTAAGLSWAREVEKSVSRESTYNLMNYRSAVLFWHYPWTNGAKSVAGTGVCFGTSVLTGRMARAMLEYKQLGPGGEPSPQTRSLAHCLAARLRLHPDWLRRSLGEMALAADLTQVPAEALLVEAAYVFPEGEVPVRATFDNDVGERTGYWRVEKKLLDNLAGTAMGAGSRCQLQAIRLRFRVADLLESSRCKFQLGLQAGVGLGLEIDEVHNAGRQAVVDFHTWRSPNFANLPPDLKDLVTVPPVALFHQ